MSKLKNITPARRNPKRLRPHTATDTSGNPTALELQALGYSIMPVGIDKRPLVKTWKTFQSTPATAAQVEQWQTKLDPVGWAVITGRLSGMITFDFDGADGIALLKKFGAHAHRRTGSGGFHLDVVAPDWRVKTQAYKSTQKLRQLWPGLDIRGEGGYVVVLGRNEAGSYKWLRAPNDLDDWDAVPPELWQYTRDTSEDRPAKRAEAKLLVHRALQQAVKDGRNDTGLWLACQLRDNGYSKAQAQPAMDTYTAQVHATNAKGEPEPYTVDEAMASLRSAYSKPPRKPWGVSAGDLSSYGQQGGSAEAPDRPRILSVAQLMAIPFESHSDLIKGWFPSHGASLMFGKPKSNKTLLAVQAAIAVAYDTPFLGRYPVLKTGPVLILAQDDPDGGATVKEIFSVSPISVKGLPIYLVPSVPYIFGPEFIDWLKREIIEKKLVFVVLDSYTKLRGSRNFGSDIVKAESRDLTLLDELAKSTNCSIVVIHHPSKGSVALEWHDQAAGTYAMGASTENQIHISRFPEFMDSAPERLVRIRGRHTGGNELVVAFRQPTLDQEYILEGGAAALYPLLKKLQTAFPSKSFGSNQLQEEMGYSRTTSYRCLARLLDAGAVRKVGKGEYELIWTKPK